MKSPLRYQSTSVDCGRTSVTNALMYLFEREELPPQAVEFVERVTGDCNLGVKGYYRGTSSHSLSFVAAWCSDYLAKAGLPVQGRALRGDEVSARDGSPLVRGLSDGAVAVCGCRLHVDHYVLMTGMEGDRIRIFDPLFEPWPPRSFVAQQEGVTWIDDCPLSHNRLVSRSVLDDPSGDAYSLFAESGRDAILLWRTNDVPVHWQD